MAKQDLKLTIQQVLSFFAVLNFMRVKQTTLRHTIISTLHCSGNFYAYSKKHSESKKIYIVWPCKFLRILKFNSVYKTEIAF